MCSKQNRRFTGIKMTQKLKKKDISHEFKCKFDEKKNVIQINGEIMISVDVSVKNVMYVKRLILNPATCSCETGKFSNYYE